MIVLIGHPVLAVREPVLGSATVVPLRHLVLVYRNLNIALRRLRNPRSRLWPRRRPQPATVLQHPTSVAFRLLELSQNLVGVLHGHTTEVRHEVHAIRVACELALGAFLGLFPADREHIAAVATPVGTHV